MARILVIESKRLEYAGDSFGASSIPGALERVEEPEARMLTLI